MKGDVVVTLDMGRMLRRVRNAGGPLPRHDLYHGTTGCSVADLEACLTHGLVVEVPNPKPTTRRSFPLIALTRLGLNVLAVFRFPAPGKKATPKYPAAAENHPWRTSAVAKTLPAADDWAGMDSDAGAFLSDLVRRCQRGETLAVD